jgi:hypothetical protein
MPRGIVMNSFRFQRIFTSSVRTFQNLRFGSLFFYFYFLTKSCSKYLLILFCLASKLMILRSMDTVNEVDDCLNNPRAEPLRMRTERDQLNNLIEQRTKYLKVPSEKMEEVRYSNKLQKYR